jgi:hypothetical protein
MIETFANVGALPMKSNLELGSTMLNMVRSGRARC